MPLTVEKQIEIHNEVNYLLDTFPLKEELEELLSQLNFALETIEN